MQPTLALIILILLSPLTQASTILGGTANIDVTPGAGVPLGGYGGGKRRLIPWDIFNKYPYAKYFKPNKGVRDPIRSKAMVLTKGDQRLLFISLDIVGAIDHIKADIVKRLAIYGFKSENVFLTATHTHSGPGALTYNSVWALLAVDKFSSKVYQDLLDGIIRSVETAITRLEPVSLMSNRFEVEGVQKNRGNKPGVFNNKANMLLLRSQKTGDWLGGLVNLPIHGVALGTSNLHFSADIPGAVERKIENRLAAINSTAASPPTLLFIQGALGDVSPIQRGEQGIEQISEHISRRAMDSLSSLRKISPNWQIFEKEVYIGKAGFNIYACSKKTFWGKLIRWAHLSKRMRISLKKWFPRYETLSAIKLGDMLMVTWPGEPTATLGQYLEQMGANKNAVQTWILAVTNSHLAYFVTPDEEQAGTKEACNMLYKSHISMNIIDAYDELIHSIY